jgi:DNA-binding MarR family transcriptional regulator
MGRGLSKLQKTILSLAYRNRLDRLERAATADTAFERNIYERGGYSIDLYDSEVLREHFGWEPRSIWWRPALGEARPHYGQIFKMSEIGERRYRSTRSSLSRAVTRLEDRALVERRHLDLAGLDLTDRGIEEAEKLVNAPTLGE